MATFDDRDAEQITLRVVGRDTTIVRAGAPQRFVLVVVSGAINVYARAPNGRRGCLTAMMRCGWSAAAPS